MHIRKLRLGKIILQGFDNSRTYALTEIVMNDDKRFYEIPTPHELGLYGSFVAFRVLEQDVAGFEKFLQDYADQIEPEKLAAKLCGRWRNGVPQDLQGLLPRASPIRLRLGGQYPPQPLPLHLKLLSNPLHRLLHILPAIKRGNAEVAFTRSTKTRTRCTDHIHALQ